MIKFPKEITSEFFEYTTHLSLVELKTAIRNLIDDTNGIGFSSNLTAKSIQENEFQITSKWEIGPFVSGLLSPINTNTSSNLKVFVYQNKKHVTHVNLLVIPNSYYPSLFVLLPMALVVLLWIYKNDTQVIEAYLIIIPLLILCPVIILMVSKFLKKRLKNRLVNYLHLQEII